MLDALLAILLAGTAPVPPDAPPPAHAAMDLSAAAPPQPGQVMAIPGPLRDLVRARVGPGARQARLERLVALLFAADGLGMTYEEHATHTVADAYRLRKANCLTFTMMTIALAREAGLEAYPQEIERTLSWNSSGQDMFVQNMHVNAGVVANRRRFTIDVATDQLLTHAPPRRVSDARLLSLYYNNRAIELLLDGRGADAERWLRQSLALDPSHATPWNNAGVLAQRNGDLPAARRHFLEALERNPAHTGALANIVSHYQRIGAVAEAAAWRRRAERVSQRDPLQQFLLGRHAEQRGDLAEAIARYTRAVRLDRGQHSFHSAIARVWLQLGDPARARRALLVASQLEAGDTRQHYQAKLDRLDRTPY